MRPGFAECRNRFSRPPFSFTGFATGNVVGSVADGAPIWSCPESPGPDDSVELSGSSDGGAANGAGTDPICAGGSSVAACMGGGGGAPFECAGLGPGGSGGGGGAGLPDGDEPGNAGMGGGGGGAFPKPFIAEGSGAVHQKGCCRLM